MKSYIWRTIGLLILIIGISGLFYFIYSNISQLNTDDNLFYLGGIQINEPNYDDWTNTIQEIGMNTVSVTVYCKQGSWDSDHLWYENEWDANSGILAEIRAAKAKGLKVVLIPRVAIDHAFDKNKFIWHGMIFPKTKEDVEYWFKSYGKFVQHWAKISEKEGVDILAIGSEMRAIVRTLPINKIPNLEEYHLNKSAQKGYIDDHLKHQDRIKTEHLWVRGFDNYKSLNDYLNDRVAIHETWAKTTSFNENIQAINERRVLLDQQWRNLIDSVRTVYAGKVTYAANFDNYHNIGFWDKLDFMGINAYFKLREPNKSNTDEEKLAEATQSWRSIFKDIEEFKQIQSIDNKKVIFTELGYIAKKNCMIAPWEGFGFSIVHTKLGLDTEIFLWKDEQPDSLERAIALRALHNVHEEYNRRLLRGILYWKLTTKAYHLPYEPFGLCVRKNSIDALQKELIKFK